MAGWAVEKQIFPEPKIYLRYRVKNCDRFRNFSKKEKKHSINKLTLSEETIVWIHCTCKTTSIVKISPLRRLQNASSSSSSGIHTLSKSFYLRYYTSTPRVFRSSFTTSQSIYSQVFLQIRGSHSMGRDNTPAGPQKLYRGGGVQENFKNRHCISRVEK